MFGGTSTPVVGYMILIGGALDAHAVAVVGGKVQPEQSGAVKVCFAVPVPVPPPDAPDDPAEPSMLKLPLLPPRQIPLQPPSSEVPPPLAPPLLLAPPPDPVLN